MKIEEILVFWVLNVRYKMRRETILNENGGSVDRTIIEMSNNEFSQILTLP
jgi:hypothetical protein